MCYFIYDSENPGSQTVQLIFNKKKLGEFDIIKGKLVKIKIFQENGVIANETELENGRLINLKNYQAFEHPDTEEIKSGLKFNINFDMLGKQKLEVYNMITNKLTFDGFYNEGKANGKATMWYENGNCQFEGAYLNNKRQDYCIEYYENGTKKHEGKYQNGIQKGKCVNYYPDQVIKMNGQQDDTYFRGALFDTDGDLSYYGEMKFNSRRNGFGRSGKGTSYFQEKMKYSGNWKNDKYEGFGTLYYDNKKMRYCGYFQNNKFYGSGLKFDHEGKIICNGDWIENKLAMVYDTPDQGTEHWQSIELPDTFYMGEFKNSQIEDVTFDVASGQGYEYLKNGLKIMKGSYEGMLPHGIVCQYHKDQNFYGGAHLIGKKHYGFWNGRVATMDQNGKLKRRSYFDMNDELDSIFSIHFLPNGEIDFTKSYKGTNMNDYEIIEYFN